MTDSRERFSDRVENYVRYRPGYPDDLVASLFAGGVDIASTNVADIGSGTGIFTKMLLQQGARVFAVEPNAAMRRAAEKILGDYENFSSINGDAENTGLDDASIDLVTAAQAFHWFDNAETLAEFQRILRPHGRVALIWNKRRLEQPFQQAYDALLRQLAPEYGKVNHMNLGDDDIAEFFAPGEVSLSHFDYLQRFDFDSLLGRLQSSSYCPPQATPEFERLGSALSDLFDQYARDGMLDFEYDTLLYLGAVRR